MCGRYELHSALEIIAVVFGIDPKSIKIAFKPNFNVAPTNHVLTVVQNGNRRLVESRWGFIPTWSKEAKTGYTLINARAETVAEKPTFRQAFMQQRCIIPADGFYEWRKTQAGKQPVYIHLRSKKPMGFAGLYNVWTSPDGEKINTCTIIVTNANDLISPIHDRMPVIVSPDKFDTWLDPSVLDPASLNPIMQPYPSSEIELYNVTPRVNSVKNNSANMIEPIG